MCVSECMRRPDDEVRTKTIVWTEGYLFMRVLSSVAERPITCAAAYCTLFVFAKF
jgi:hypothetical protein